MDFLEEADVPARTWRDEAQEERGRYWTGQGRDAVEVAYTRFDHEPTVAEVRGLWKQRHGRRAAPLLLVAAHGDRAWLCGPVGEDPAVVVRDVAQAQRLAATALAEPSRHFATQFLANALETADDDVPGLRNRGLLATHELQVGVPQRADWSAATARAQPLMQSSGRALVESLGFEVEERRAHAVLRSGTAGNARAVAVFLDATEQPDQPSDRFDRQSPVTFALTQAERDGLPYVVAVRGPTLRLYSTATSGAVGQRGRSETYVGLDLPLLPSDMAGYLTLLFSAEALAPGGTFEDISRASQNFTTDLSTRLRERIYGDVVPTLATAIAKRRSATIETKEDLDAHFQVAVTVLFRLLFIAYAEDSRLLPLYSDDDYTHHALKTIARGFARAINDGQDLGFNNPLSNDVEPVTDTKSSDLWDGCQALFYAVDQGRPTWSVPPYNGGLFSSDPQVNPAGPMIEQLDLTNAEVGPALVALLVDKTPDGVIGPIDFRSLSVREFGTIYEGLLESELARADQDLALSRDGVYVPAAADDVVVAEGEVYLHNRSGARKASGSYFTKPFAVEHLVNTAVLPTLDEHLARIEQLLDAGDEASAAEQLFDFRVADIAMGSGHFLTAVVDALEARYSAFLADHRIPQVAAMLGRLRRAASDNLGELADTVEIENSALLRRLIARRCVYGVDLNPIATELARVSMWIHTFVPGLPLSFLDHNLRVGDSLTGIGTLDEALDELTEAEAQPALFDEPLRVALAQAKEPLARLSNIVDATTDDLVAARRAAADARDAVQPVADLLDLLVAHRLGEVARPTITSLDELANHEVRMARRVAADLNVLHFPVAFPEVFTRERPGFDVLVGNPPWEEATVEEPTFWSLWFPGLRSMSEAQRLAEIERLESEYPGLKARYETEAEGMARLRQLLHAGPYPGMEAGDPDLYKAFAWRFFHLAREGGALGVVLPRSAFQAQGSAPWRRSALPSSNAFIVTVRNGDEWVFTDVNPGYTICLAVLHQVRQGAGTLRLAGRYEDPDEFRAGIARGGTILPAEALSERIPEAALPDLGSDQTAALFATLTTIPGIGEDRTDFEVYAIREFDATNDRKKTGILKADGDTPVFNHRNIAHFCFDLSEGEFTRADWDEAIAVLRQRKTSGAQRKNSPFSRVAARRGRAWLDDATAPSERPRIAIRDVVHASNPRKVWAALVPAGTLLTNASPYLLFAEGDVREQLYLLGMLGSSVCDWWGHLFVNLHLNFFIFYGLPIPVAEPDDPRVDRIAEVAATLAVTEVGDYGEYSAWAVDDGERETLVAELDGLAALLYGLADEHLPLVWDDQHAARPPLGDVKHYRDLWAKHD